MPTLDIPLPEALTKALEEPRCADLRLPKASFPELRLPTGGTIKGIADVTKGIPSDCSMNVSLALQVAPIMASMECLLKVLKFLGVLIKTFQNLSTGNVAGIPGGLGDIAKAGADVAECIGMVASPAIPFGQFIKDLLLMIAKMLKCMLQSLTSIVELLDGLELEIASAAQNGNDALAAQLECAKENAMLAADGAMQSIDPIATILALAEPFLGLLPGAPTIQLPQLASDASLDSLKQTLTTLEQVVQAIEGAAEAIPV
ncbi:hypothetical protein SAMN06265365_10654 [Tistlia consotensis]|uniref:Uncharacterized protein n=1 Tax=Tistlia consotensis USBA 355 TaxID=560819 RepID=A0A1Y6BBS1_9PROT|nr:hypothetical protein [Tistlia consotensis]SMF03006.1 hypothetical protein SAMN05428998_103105 [Tistlia consotensis USBA 355]SNR53354.1 hypothetical protein SAMN06265365_10654 [Tistlia consotensis]